MCLEKLKFFKHLPGKIEIFREIARKNRNFSENCLEKLTPQISNQIDAADTIPHISPLIIVGRDGALVEAITFNRRVVGSTTALAVTYGPWASPLPAVSSALRC